MSTLREIVNSGKGAAVIMAGSDSDSAHIEKLQKALDEYGIPFEVRIASAHKQPETLTAMVREYDEYRGPLAIIAVAGGTDALSGTASFHSLHPVISCPPDAPNQSCLTNPPGSSNAYIARPDNVARFIAQMFSHHNPDYVDTLSGQVANKVRKLQEADGKFRKTYGIGRQTG